MACIRSRQLVAVHTDDGAEMVRATAQSEEMAESARLPQGSLSCKAIEEFSDAAGLCNTSASETMQTRISYRVIQ